MGRIVFADEGARRRLEAIVHPLVFERIVELEAAASPEDVVVHDIPLLAESGRADTFDAVIVVDADPELQIERMIAERGWTREDAESRMLAQASREDRLAIATHVIENDGTLDSCGPGSRRSSGSSRAEARDAVTARGPRPGAARHRRPRVQPAAGGGQRRAGARRDPRRASTCPAPRPASSPRCRCIAFAVFGALAPRLGRPGRPAPADPGRRWSRSWSGCSAAAGSTRSRASWRSACWRWPGWPPPTCCCPSLVRRHFPDRVGTMTAVVHDRASRSD